MDLAFMCDTPFVRSVALTESKTLYISVNATGSVELENRTLGATEWLNHTFTILERITQTWDLDDSLGYEPIVWVYLDLIDVVLAQVYNGVIIWGDQDH